MSIPQRNTSLIAAVAAVLALPFLVSIATAHGEPLEVVDLQDLADGETRTFGEGDRAVTATREGDRVLLTLRGGDGEKTLSLDRTLDCDLATDDCVVKFGTHGADGNVFVLEMGSGDGDRVERRVEVVTAVGAAHGDGRTVVVEAAPRVRVLRLGDHADAEAHMEDLRIELERLGDHLEHLTIPAMPVVIVAGDGERVVRCPEGDTTMTVAEDEADGAYRCPKHGVALEPVAEAHGPHRFEWRIDGGDDGDDDDRVEL